MSYTSRPIVDHAALLKPVGYARTWDCRFAAEDFICYRQAPKGECLTALYTQAQLDSGYANLREQRDRLKRRIKELEK